MDPHEPDEKQAFAYRRVFSHDSWMGIKRKTDLFSVAVLSNSHSSALKAFDVRVREIEYHSQQTDGTSFSESHFGYGDSFFLLPSMTAIFVRAGCTLRTVSSIECLLLLLVVVGQLLASQGVALCPGLVFSHPSWPPPFFSTRNKTGI